MIWKTVKINDVCLVTDYVANGSFKSLSDNVEYLTNDGYAILVRLTDFTKGWNGNYKYVDEHAYNFLAKTKLFAGDLLISNVGEPGKTFLVPELDMPMTLGPNSILVRPDNNVLNTKFFKYLIDSPYGKSLLDKITSGTTQKKFNKTGFRNLEIPLPPLPEQERIVAKLDAAFAEIDIAVEAVKKNIQNSKRYYSYAIDNEFSKYSDKTKSIGEHSKINYGHTAKASFEKGRYKFLRITDIQGNAVDWNSVPYCEVETKKLPSVLLNDGDIVFARTGATTGKSFLVENPVDSVFASYLIRVSIDKKVFLPKYVMHYFQSAAYWQQVNEGISGAAQGGFNATKLRELRIPIINKTEQLEVVQKLDLINEQSASLQNTYTLKMHALNSLKSAILSSELKLSEAA